jgi:hypothetical protein
MPKEKAQLEAKMRNEAPPVTAVTAEPPQKEGGPSQVQRAADKLRESPPNTSVSDRARLTSDIQRSVGNAQLGQMLGAPVQTQATESTLSDTGEQKAESMQEEQRKHIPIQAKIRNDIARKKKITTPVGKDVTITRRGAAKLEVSGVNVMIKPDRRSKKKAMKNKAETNFELRWRTPGYRYRGNRITSVNTVPKPTMTIQTTYGPGVTRKSPSQYGRGTTAEDIKAGKTTLGYHESRHGLDYIQYLRDHPLPKFKGRVGMTVAEYKQALKEYDAAMHEYKQAIYDYSVQRTDCVGVKGGFCRDLSKEDLDIASTPL